MNSCGYQGLTWTEPVDLLRSHNVAYSGGGGGEHFIGVHSDHKMVKFSFPLHQTASMSCEVEVQSEVLL